MVIPHGSWQTAAHGPNPASYLTLKKTNLPAKNFYVLNVYILNSYISTYIVVV